MRIEGSVVASCLVSLHLCVIIEYCVQNKGAQKSSPVLHAVHITAWMDIRSVDGEELHSKPANQQFWVISIREA